jgi:hypothetical protein
MTGKRMFWIAAVLSVVLKAILSQQGFNYDVYAYDIIAGYVLQGQCIYAGLTIYNYGPIWFCVLAVLQFCARHLPLPSPAGLHLLVALLLSVVDVLLAVWAWRRYKRWSTAMLFLFNPVSFLITGYHSQFDNVALLLALYSATLMVIGSEWAFFGGLCLLGVSLTTKHLFIFFPIWLFFSHEVRKRGSYAPWLALSVPVLVFLLSFAPFLGNPAARAGIYKNVFCYNSLEGQALFPQIIYLFVSPEAVNQLLGRVPVLAGMKLLMFAAICWCGFALRKSRIEDSVLYYSVAICVFAAAFADQYLAIPVLASFLLVPPGFRTWYLIASCVYLLLPTSTNLHPEFLARLFPKGLLLRWNSLMPIFLWLVMTAWKKGIAAPLETGNVNTPAANGFRVIE